jgi:hypothetical protein
MRLTAVLLAAAALFSIAIGRSAINSSEPTGVHVAAYWDPSVTVDDNACYKAIENGARLTRRLDANDEAAGRLWEDTRTPPSARSEWIDTQLTRDLNYWGWRESDWNQALVCDYSDDSNDHIHKIGRSQATRACECYILTAFWLRGHSNPKNLRYYLVLTVQNE